MCQREFTRFTALSEPIDLMGNIRLFNIQHQGTVHTPLLVIHGESMYSKFGFLTVSHRYNGFPPLYFEVNQGFFKAVVHLDDGPNDLVFTHSSGVVANGFPQFCERPSFLPGTVALTVNYQPLRNNLPIHLCVLLAMDSPTVFDSPVQKKASEGNHLEIALKKMRIGGRLMQAFTNEQMLRAGFGNRTFNFYEEPSYDSEFYQELSNPRSRHNIKVHVLRSDKSMKELRSPDLAQQNPKGRNTGGLFEIAKDALVKYGGPFNTDQPVQAAVMFLDTHWDNNLKLILTHAALGGSSGNIRLAIFGSHGLYSWPSYLEQVVPCFQDITESNINEVANDSNECSSYWECLNITLGAFMHEIGHLLGCPHQTYGVMLRDYVTLNRSFVSRETRCLRTNSSKLCPVMPKDECTWHRLDLLRFLYHTSFKLPQDIQDSSFGRLNSSGGAAILPIGNDQAIIKSSSGIYGIEIFVREIADAYVEYLPVSLGGSGVQFDVRVNSHDLKFLLPADKQNVNDFDINVLCVGGSSDMHNVIEKLSSSNKGNFVSVPSELINRQGNLNGIKSNILGSFNQSREKRVFFDSKTLTNIRVYHGSALNGMRFDYLKTNGTKIHPPIPARDYLLTSAFKKMFSGNQKSKTSSAGVPVSQSDSMPEQISVLFGNQTDNYTDFAFGDNEYLDALNLRTGKWIDCVQIVTSHNRTSGKFGNYNGGGSGSLEAPNPEKFEIVGVWGSSSNWVDSIGIIYAPKR